MSENTKDWICDMLKLFIASLLNVAVAVAVLRLGMCRGDTVISRPAGDGVNTETVTIDENGYVVSTATTTAYVPQKFTGLQSGERVNIGDMEYVVIASGDWTLLTNRIERLETIAARRWRKEHETVAGRQSWHGAATNRVIGADSVLWLYADGYTYEEKVKNPVRRTTPPAAKIRPSGVSSPVRRAVLPPRLEAKQNALKSRPAAKEVNAVFGPGGKVLKVEESK